MKQFTRQVEITARDQSNYGYLGNIELLIVDEWNIYYE